MSIENSPLTEVAMKIILHAGDARNLAKEAIDCAKKNEFLQSYEKLNLARAEIVKAHKSQTEVIQGEMSGEQYENNLLFTHAQDTLMTISSEVNLTKSMIELFELIKKEG